MELTFPKKGWHTNEARFSQPEGTSPSLLNVLAFDRENRSRGAQRPGTSKLYPAAMGNGAQPVLAALQVTRALDPTTIVPGTQLLSEPFTYADNTTVGSIDANPVDGTPDWRASSGGASFFPFLTAAAGALIILGNTAVASTGIGNALSAAIYLPAINLGAAYIVKADVFINSASSGGVAEAMGLYIRLDTGSFAQQGLVFTVYNDQCLIRNANGSVASSTFTFGTTLATGFHTIEMHVNGDVITGWVDGIQYVGLSNTLNNTVSGVGFCVGGNHKTSAHGLKNFKVLAGAPLALYRQTNTVFSCGGNIYVGDIATQPAIASGGTGIMSTVIKTQMSTSQGNVYITDGQHNLKRLVMSTLTVADISPTAGSETATTLGLYQLTCIWRDRLVLAASTAAPQNFIMSRQGTHTDFDYGQLDAAAAVAGNASKAGAIGEPLNCLIPFSDDILILGGDHSIYKVEGDIAAGGQILSLSDAIGTLGPDCWDADPEGNIYFVGTMGLFKIPKGSDQIQDISQDRIKDFFSAINRTTQYVTCSWDRDRHGLWILVSTVNTGASVHLFYDAINDAFFPQQFPDAFGPITAITYDGDGPADRVLLLCGRDGFVRKWDGTSKTDDGSTITSYVYIGPIRPVYKQVGMQSVPDEQSLGILEYIDVIFGEAPPGFTDADWSVLVQVQSGKDAYTAFASPQSALGFGFTNSLRRKKMVQRVSGGCFYFLVANNVAGKIWQLEKLSCDFLPAGMQRRY